MRCPFCQHLESKVTDSRNAVEQNAIRRRRECLGCQKRFTTFETVDLVIQVRKRDGTYEDFQQEKLIRGLDAACRHTLISHDQVRSIAYQIAMELMDRQLKEIETTELGEIVMNHLKAIDTVAYIRFACVYRRFKDMDALMDEIHSIAPQEEAQHKEESYDIEKSDIEKFKKRLQEMKRDITKLTKNVVDEVKSPEESKGYSQHQADEGTDDFNRSVSLQVTDEEFKILRQIDRALAKIEEETYGVCDVTGEIISIPRLEAIPYATMTVKAQEMLEKGLL